MNSSKCNDVALTQLTFTSLAERHRFLWERGRAPTSDWEREVFFKLNSHKNATPMEVQTMAFAPCRFVCETQDASEAYFEVLTLKAHHKTINQSRSAAKQQR